MILWRRDLKGFWSVIEISIGTHFALGFDWSEHCLSVYIGPFLVWMI